MLALIWGGLTCKEKFAVPDMPAWPEVLVAVACLLSAENVRIETIHMCQS